MRDGWFSCRLCSWRAAKADTRRVARAVEPVVGQERLAEPAAWPAKETAARPRPPDAVVRRAAGELPGPGRAGPGARRGGGGRSGRGGRPGAAGGTGAG